MNRGAALLQKHLDEKKRQDEKATRASFARELECSSMWVSLLVRGKATPGRQLALTLYRLAAIPVSAWDDPA